MLRKNHKVNLFILTATILLSLPFFVHASTLYTVTARQIVYENESFVTTFYLDTTKQEINTVNLKLLFSNDVLEVTDVNVAGSVVNLWVKPPTFSNEMGTIEMTGGVTSGVATDQALIFSATFNPKKIGTARVTMDESSEVLLSDGLGTNAPLLFNPLSFPVNPAANKPVTVISESHPNQDAWYTLNSVKLSFAPKEGEQYSYSFSSNAEMIPDNEVDELKQVYEYNNLPDGVYYFKVNYRLGNGAWQEASVYRVQIDQTPPEDLMSKVASDPSVFDGRPFLSLSAIDNTSGIEKYQVKFGILGQWQDIDQQVVKLPGLVLGDTIEIKVVDRAGNEKLKRVVVEEIGAGKWFKDWLFWVIIMTGLSLAGALVLVYRKVSKKYIR